MATHVDLLPWADVKKEMCEEKGLDPEVADRIGEFVKLKGEWTAVWSKMEGMLIAKGLRGRWS